LHSSTIVSIVVSCSPAVGVGVVGDVDADGVPDGLGLGEVEHPAGGRRLVPVGLAVGRPAHTFEVVGGGLLVLRGVAAGQTREVDRR
jgi:hypothetical protein